MGGQGSKFSIYQKYLPSDRVPLKEIEGVFTHNKFSEALKKLQKQDRLNALDTGPGKVDSKDIDKKPEVGRFKGLTLILDAHTNLLSQSYVEEDSNGFLLGLTKSGEFPLMGQGTKILRPGYEHFISLTATDTVSDRKIQANVRTKKRNCYFTEERGLQFHTNYSQSACLFECGLSWAINNSQEN